MKLWLAISRLRTCFGPIANLSTRRRTAEELHSTISPQLHPHNTFDKNKILTRSGTSYFKGLKGGLMREDDLLQVIIDRLKKRFTEIWLNFHWIENARENTVHLQPTFRRGSFLKYIAFDNLPFTFSLVDTSINY